MLTLAADEIHIHLLHPEVVRNIDETLLDETEHSRAQAFKFAKDRDLYIAAHVFLRQVLSRYASVFPKDWVFTHNVYGKPFIANAGYEGLQFNLSHTQDKVACAIAWHRAVGIDVERGRSLDDIASLCRCAFSPLEAEAVLLSPVPDEQYRRFFYYWTLKEAYIKARGMGLSLPLQGFSFIQKNDYRWSLQYEPTFPDDGKNWQFDTLLLDGNTYLAYCVEVIKNISVTPYFFCNTLDSSKT